MKTLARTLLVWFVLFAIPFQGFAAAATACTHGMAPGTAAPSTMSKHKGQHGHAAKPPCHQQVVAQADSQHDATGGDEQPHQKKCGNCSACSVGAAMAPASPGSSPDCCPCSCCPSAAPARVAAIDPELPERPPRTLLA